jgi:hypothetical protein
MNMLFIDVDKVVCVELQKITFLSALILRYCFINKYCFSREIGRKLFEGMFSC